MFSKLRGETSAISNYALLVSGSLQLKDAKRTILFEYA